MNSTKLEIQSTAEVSSSIDVDPVGNAAATLMIPAALTIKYMSVVIASAFRGRPLRLRATRVMNRKCQSDLSSAIRKISDGLRTVRC